MLGLTPMNFPIPGSASQSAEIINLHHLSVSLLVQLKTYLDAIDVNKPSRVEINRARVGFYAPKIEDIGWAKPFLSPQHCS